MADPPLEFGFEKRVLVPGMARDGSRSTAKNRLVRGKDDRQGRWMVESGSAKSRDQMGRNCQAGVFHSSGPDSWPVPVHYPWH